MQIVQRHCRIDHQQFSQCHALNSLRELSRKLLPEYFLCFPVSKGFDHTLNIPVLRVYCKRNNFNRHARSLLTQTTLVHEKKFVHFRFALDLCARRCEEKRVVRHAGDHLPAKRFRTLKQRQCIHYFRVRRLLRRLRLIKQAHRSFWLLRAPSKLDASHALGGVLDVH